MRVGRLLTASSHGWMPMLSLSVLMWLCNISYVCVVWLSLQAAVSRLC